MTTASGYCEIDFPHPAQPGQRIAAAFSNPATILQANRIDEVTSVLQRAEQHALDGNWVMGFVAYEAAAAFDSALHTYPAPPSGMPYAWFAVYAQPGSRTAQRGEHLCGRWQDETPRAQFDAAIASIRSGITAGDYYQVNYTTRLRTALLGNSLSFFDSLCASQPGAYCAHVDFGAGQICSVSPELFFHWEPPGATRQLTCRPMKGTAARHANPEQDRQAAQQLQQSAKERAENLMIVDLMRNDLSRLAQPGSVRAEPLFAVEAWSTVWQMTSTVSSVTRPEVGLHDVFQALFPCGSVTGAPKSAAMSAIQSLEQSPRGVYCGAIGLLQPGGEALFSVGIRTPVSDSEGTAECGIGSGITLDSVASSEHAEWHAKQEFLRRASPEYELLETLRLHQGRYWLQHGHLQRLQQSAQVLGFVHDEQEVRNVLMAAASEHATGQWRVRLLLSPDGTVRAEVHPYDELPAQSKIALSATPVSSSDPWLRHKTTRRGIYSELALPNVFDTLLYNERGELTEFTRGNLVVERDGRLLTPPVACGLLPGVMRDMLLRRKRINEVVLKREDLAQARRIWFINSVRGAIAVSLQADLP